MTETEWLARGNPGRVLKDALSNASCANADILSPLPGACAALLGGGRICGKEEWLMSDNQTFLEAMQEHPEDASMRLGYAAWLEERGDPRGELLRLLHTLTQAVEVPDRSELEDRLRALVASGVQPVGPFFTNSLGMKFAWIPAGTFMMGSPESEEGRFSEVIAETLHPVTLPSGFYLAIHAVTQACWQEVMGNKPSYFQGDHLPVEQVSWDDCQEFLRKLSGRDGCSYRLPSEAEWEYACRAGTTTPSYFGQTISTDQANYSGQGVCRGKTTPVGSFPPNAWGLYDMHGNVEEWCADSYGEFWPDSGENRAVRGGSFADIGIGMRSAYRPSYLHTVRERNIGFRPMRSYES
jgi:uncharacterized protein (TIGR02996 family)